MKNELKALRVDLRTLQQKIAGIMSMDSERRDELEALRISIERLHKVVGLAREVGDRQVRKQ